MDARELEVLGAYEFRPRVFADDRGLFVSPFQETAVRGALGRPLFPVRQTNHSLSRRGVVRGAHYTRTPPGCAKYVYCARGKALDMVIDIRTGSPTYGKWDAVQLDPQDFRAVYLPVGTAHCFVALEDDTVMSYMLSGEYVSEDELALDPFDPELGLPIPGGVEPVVSERDSVAPRLAELAARGELPDYEQCLKLERELVAA